MGKFVPFNESSLGRNAWETPAVFIDVFDGIKPGRECEVVYFPMGQTRKATGWACAGNAENVFHPTAG